MTAEFIPFAKIARLKRSITVTEKIDGTNAAITINDEGTAITGIQSRTRLIKRGDDNAGFADWVESNNSKLLGLGPGTHFGEWWGKSIQRRYGLDHKRFSLFNSARWTDNPLLPDCCHVVPVLYHGVFSDVEIDATLERLRTGGSVAAPGFMNPEGIVVWHAAAQLYFKRTLDADEVPKGSKEAA